jgi:hypothetical protein
MVSGLSEKLSLRANSLSEQAKNTSNEDIKDANRKLQKCTKFTGREAIGLAE